MVISEFDASLFVSHSVGTKDCMSSCVEAGWSQIFMQGAASIGKSIERLLAASVFVAFLISLYSNVTVTLKLSWPEGWRVSGVQVVLVCFYICTSTNKLPL